MSGTNGGIWRSLDTGQDLARTMLAGQATDVVLDAGQRLGPRSRTTGTDAGQPPDRLRGLRGQGVYMSPNQGQVWNLMAGGVGDPLIQDPTPSSPNVEPGHRARPPTAPGRIVLAEPAPTGNAAQDLIYAGLALRRRGHSRRPFGGLYVTKDLGQNWTKVAFPPCPPGQRRTFNQASRPTTSASPTTRSSAEPTLRARATTTSAWRSTRPTRTSSTSAAHDGNPGPDPGRRHRPVWTPTPRSTWGQRHDGGTLDLATAPTRRRSSSQPGRRRTRTSTTRGSVDPTHPYLNLIRDPIDPFRRTRPSTSPTSPASPTAAPGPSGSRSTWCRRSPTSTGSSR